MHICINRFQYIFNIFNKYISIKSCQVMSMPQLPHHKGRKTPSMKKGSNFTKNLFASFLFFPFLHLRFVIGTSRRSLCPDVAFCVHGGFFETIEKKSGVTALVVDIPNVDTVDTKSVSLTPHLHTQHARTHAVRRVT